MIVEKFKNFVGKNKFLDDITRVLYSCSFGRITNYVINRNLLKNFDETLLQLDKAFNQENICYWPAFGTLLGLYRDGSVLKHDLDIDIGVWSDEDHDLIRTTLERHGFRRVRSFSSITVNEAYEERYSYKGVGIDIFFFSKCGSKAITHDFVRSVKVNKDDTEFLVRRLTVDFENLGLGCLEYNGMKLNIPMPIDKHLSSRYGNDFMTPNPKWSYRSGAKSIQDLSQDGLVYFYE